MIILEEAILRKSNPRAEGPPETMQISGGIFAPAAALWLGIGYVVVNLNNFIGRNRIDDCGAVQRMQSRYVQPAIIGQ